MNKILQLPQHIISQIAAGEVIERPSYAIKELLENAIDAGSDVIEIQLEEAGLKKIKVIDNGEGMSKEDLKLSFLPHTTSKLSSGQITGIRTLGFRGEALSSIASIATLTIQSRDKEAVGGTSVQIKQGTVEKVSGVGMPRGTIIIVENLFAGIPARKKFLKSIATELRHCTDVVMNIALSHPSIHVILSHNGKIVFDIPRRDSLLDRLKLLLGVTLVDQLIPLSYEEGYIKIEGFIGHPQISAKNNQRQYIFVNNRFVRDPMISLAVKESFATLIPSSNSPVFLLYITVPYEFVDVNIHPRKEQVSFSSPSLLFDAIKLSVSETLKENNISFHLAKFQDHSARTGETKSFAGQLLKQTISKGKPNTEVTIISQLDTVYIVSLSGNTLTLTDQHAAHERILYECLLRVFQDEKKKRQTSVLSSPVTLSLSVSDSLLLAEQLSLLEEIGFVIEHFQGEEFVIREIPRVFQGRKILKILLDMLDDLRLEKKVSGIDLPSQRMLAFLACRSAVKAGDTLAQDEMSTIVQDLQSTPNNSTCPHGRPTTITLTRSELDKTFKRS